MSNGLLLLFLKTYTKRLIYLVIKIMLIRNRPTYTHSLYLFVIISCLDDEDFGIVYNFAL